jgi:Secretion system C-terminal sorting domain
MKKTLLYLFIALGMMQIQAAFAQCPGCAINTGCTVSPAKPTLCPDTLPAGYAGQAYDQDASFYMPETFVDQGTGFNVNLDKITVTGVVGIPYGLNFQTSSATNEFFPNNNPPTTEHGCVKFCGIPLIPGQYVITVYITAEVTVLGLGQTEYDSFELPIEILPSTTGNSSFTIGMAQGCSPVVTGFTPVHTSSGNPLYTYAWDFGNGNTSSLEIPPPQTHITPNTYYVSLATTIDTLGYFLDEVTVQASSCTDTGSKPDHYIKVYKGTTKLYESPHTASMNNDSPVTFNFPTITLSNTTYSIEVWDDDNFLGGTDDHCGTVTFNGHNAGYNSLFDGSTVVNFTIDHPVLNFDDTDSVIVYPSPTLTPLTVSPGDTVCDYDTITLMVNSGSQYLYQWYLDGIVIPAQIDTILQVVDTDGEYHAKAINNFGCYTESETHDLYFYDSPAAPTFWSNGNVLSTLSGATLQWYLDGIAIPGANQQNYTITQTGDYMLCASNAAGCEQCSGESYIIFSSIKDYESLIDMKVYPNPSNGIFTIELFGVGESQAVITITDLTGRTIFNNEIEFTQHFVKEYDLTHTAKGAYIIHVSTEQGSAFEKLIVQ